MIQDEQERQLVTDVSKYLDDQFIAEFQAQGHHLTGAFENSLFGTVLNSLICSFISNA